MSQRNALRRAAGTTTKKSKSEEETGSSAARQTRKGKNSRAGAEGKKTGRRDARLRAERVHEK